MEKAYTCLGKWELGMRQTVNNRGHRVSIETQTSHERLYAIQNKDKRNQARNKRFEDPEYRREKYDIRNKSRKIAYAKDRQSVFKILGGAFCNICHYEDYPEALQIDHIFGTGHLDKLRFNRRDKMFRYYKNHPFEAIEYLQILCANCNQIKIWNKI